jgi:macrolide transport system ATP-binding/permease protein
MTPPATQALVARDVVRVLGGRRVLDGADLTASPGQRIGLVGENGSGKTTLLRVLAGVDEPDAGHVTRPAHLGLLHQEPPFAPGDTVGGVLDEALAPVRRLLAELDRLGTRMAETADDAATRNAYADTLELAERLEAWDAERRAGLVRHGLGLGDLPADRPAAHLSGGERSRLALTALLVRRPDALLLDEPTNHLDDDALAFLESHLRGMPGVVVGASHDRTFLDAVCTHLVDLDPVYRPGEGGSLVRYTGAYSAYRRAKVAERARWEQAYGGFLDEVDGLVRSIEGTARRVAPGRPISDNNKVAYDRHGGRVEASVSSRVRNARQRLADLLDDPVPRPPLPLRFAPPDGPDHAMPDDAPPLLLATPAVVAGRLDVERVEIGDRDRLLVTGPNGAGKSTLLHLLASPATYRRPGTRVALLTQDDAFDRPGRTAAEALRAALPGATDDGPTLTDLGLLGPADADRPLGHLSVGQRRRVALAIAMVRAPHVLLLDEPSNHLSLTLVEDLEDALDVAPAAVVIATHDRWLRSRWQGRHLRLDGGRAA